MDFGLSEDQRQFGDALRRFLTDRVTMDVRRTGDDVALWAGLCKLGLSGLLVPEEAGGAGLGMLDAALVAEALGRHAAPTPFLGSAVLAPLALRDTPYLPEIAAGRMRVAACLGALTGSTGAVTLRRDGNRISGNATALLEAAGATHLLLALPDGALTLVAADASGVALRPRRALIGCARLPIWH
ncbi:acyl-CoA dehydrogenase family protein [Dankookia sp. P2]|uniref:acyl-CoA dehydrogenase family protein n=1 Tax=Dankookia sp. P2 TaxID=3423955 RepID=UPI003D66AD87